MSGKEKIQAKENIMTLRLATNDIISIRCALAGNSKIVFPNFSFISPS